MILPSVLLLVIIQSAFSGGKNNNKQYFEFTPRLQKTEDNRNEVWNFRVDTRNRPHYFNISEDVINFLNCLGTAPTNLPPVTIGAYKNLIKLCLYENMLIADLIKNDSINALQEGVPYYAYKLFVCFAHMNVSGWDEDRHAAEIIVCLKEENPALVIERVANDSTDDVQIKLRASSVGDCITASNRTTYDDKILDCMQHYKTHGKQVLNDRTKTRLAKKGRPKRRYKNTGWTFKLPTTNTGKSGSLFDNFQALQPLFDKLASSLINANALSNKQTLDGIYTFSEKSKAKPVYELHLDNIIVASVPDKHGMKINRPKHTSLYLNYL